jgi:outer membrane murein-binding lipoprotein Lpp
MAFYAPQYRPTEAETRGNTMIKLTIAAVALGVGLTAGATSPAWAQRKDCNDLKGEIEAKIKKNGVDKFTLDILEKDAQADGKVVGSCDGGTKKIVYKRG